MQEFSSAVDRLIIEASRNLAGTFNLIMLVVVITHTNLEFFETDERPVKFT